VPAVVGATPRVAGKDLGYTRSRERPGSGSQQVRSSLYASANLSRWLLAAARVMVVCLLRVVMDNKGVAITYSSGGMWHRLCLRLLWR
jgi:hypothetical protein